MSGALSRLVRPAVPLIDAFVDVVEPAISTVAPGVRWVAVETADDDLAFYRVSRRGVVLLGLGRSLPDAVRRAFAAKLGAAAELRLQADRIVTAEIKVPAEAAGFAAEIVESRLDRLTPWSPEKLVHGFAVVAKPGADGLVTVDIAATSREIVAASIARLGAFGLQPARVGSAAQPIEAALRIDLLKGEGDTTRQRRRRRIATGALLLLALSLCGLVGTTIAASISAQQVTEADAALSAVRRKLADAQGTGGDRTRETALLAAKIPDAASFVLIDRISNALPDTTYLDGLDIQPGSLTLSGTSTDVSALIALLESVPTLSQASFASPVIRQEDGRDRFDIAVLRQAVEGAVAP